MLRKLFIIAMLLLLFVTSTNTLHAQSPVFVGEAIRFQISDSLCFVSANYFFYNSAEFLSKTRLFYPVPVHEDQPFPLRFHVQSMSSDSSIPYTEHEDGISFILELGPATEEEILVQYWQEVEKNRFKYILISTQKWGRALEWANYEIHIPTKLKLKSCSLKIDTMIVRSDYIIHSIAKQKFLPTEDFEIKWGTQ